MPRRCGVIVGGRSGAIASVIVVGGRAVRYRHRGAHSIDVGIAIGARTSNDAGIPHELEAALAAIVAPSSSDVGIAIVASAIGAP